MTPLLEIGRKRASVLREAAETVSRSKQPAQAAADLNDIIGELLETPAELKRTYRSLAERIAGGERGLAQLNALHDSFEEIFDSNLSVLNLALESASKHEANGFRIPNRPALERTIAELARMREEIFRLWGKFTPPRPGETEGKTYSIEEVFCP